MPNLNAPINFRDVGEALGLWLDPTPLSPGRFYRGGRLDALTQPVDIGNPRTILNLRSGPDPQHLGAVVVHVPAPNSVENYGTGNRHVAAWVRQALGVLADPATLWPVYVHCTSGRDRTGVVVAAALLGLGVPRDVVAEEYLLSDGAEPALIAMALDGLASFEYQGPCAAIALRRGMTGSV